MGSLFKIYQGCDCEPRKVLRKTYMPLQNVAFCLQTISSLFTKICLKDNNDLLRARTTHKWNREIHKRNVLLRKDFNGVYSPGLAMK